MTETEGGGMDDASVESSEAVDLMRSARAAREQAHAPYSGFAVGAALLDGEGRIHVGANVENASYGLTICAERAAVFRAIAEGSRSFLAIAIAGPDEAVPCFPCGACRQVLHEFAPGMLILVDDPSGVPATWSLDRLLPQAFGSARLVEPSSSPSPGKPASTSEIP